MADENKPKTEPPKRWPSIKAGVRYHIKNKIAGWFVVGLQVFWTYPDGQYCTAAIRVDEIDGLENIYQ